MEWKNNLTAAALTVVVVLSALSAAACFGSDNGNNEGNALTIYINGTEYKVDELFSSHSEITINASGKAYTGVSLSLLINESGLANPGSYQYSITATDGYHKNVTWGDMQKGVLVKENTMTAFSNLPKRYMIKNVGWINATHSTTITVNGRFFTYDEPFDIFKDSLKTVQDNESNNYTGVGLSDLINLTGLSNPEGHNYTFTAQDGYNKTVTWGDMEKGVLVKDKRQAIFPGKDKKLWVKDIVEIKVV